MAYVEWPSTHIRIWLFRLARTLPPFAHSRPLDIELGVALMTTIKQRGFDDFVCVCVCLCFLCNHHTRTVCGMTIKLRTGPLSPRRRLSLRASAKIVMSNDFTVAR